MQIAPYLWVYILASKRNGTLYIGVTGNPARRIMAHREGSGSAFTSKYKITRLVHIEAYSSAEAALIREKRLKNWRRAWKIALIEENNPQWNDLWYDIIK